MKKINLLFSFCFIIPLYIFIQLGVIPLPFNSEITPSVTAHRGDSFHAPENTLPAYALAAETGADYIEIDVRRTADGVLIAFHDETLKRIAGHSTLISDLTFKELSQYKIAANPHQQPAPVCTLEEIFEHFGSHASFNLDLKTDGIEKQTVLLIQKYNLESKCLISCRNLSALKIIDQMEPGIETVYILPNVHLKYTDYDFIDAVSVKSSYITASFVNSVHHSGKKIYAWTVNSRNTLKRMCHLNVDGIITDDPSATIDFINSHCKKRS